MEKFRKKNLYQMCGKFRRKKIQNSNQLRYMITLYCSFVNKKKERYKLDGILSVIYFLKL